MPLVLMPQEQTMNTSNETRATSNQLSDAGIRDLLSCF